MTFQRLVCWLKVPFDCWKAASTLKIQFDWLKAGLTVETRIWWKRKFWAFSMLKGPLDCWGATLIIARLPWLVKIRVDGWKAHCRSRRGDWWGFSVTVDRHLQLFTSKVDSRNTLLVVETWIMNLIAQTNTNMIAMRMDSGMPNVILGKYWQSEHHVDCQIYSFTNEVLVGLLKTPGWKSNVLKIRSDCSHPHLMVKSWMWLLGSKCKLDRRKAY